MTIMTLKPIMHSILEQKAVYEEISFAGKIIIKQISCQKKHSLWRKAI
jgi:hypothetical protein